MVGLGGWGREMRGNCRVEGVWWGLVVGRGVG